MLPVAEQATVYIYSPEAFSGLFLFYTMRLDWMMIPGAFEEWQSNIVLEKKSG